MDQSEDDGEKKVHDKLVPLAKDAALKAMASLLGPAGLLVELGQMAVGTFIQSGTERLQAAVQEEIVDAVLRRLPEVARKVEKLAECHQVTTVDFARILEGFAKAYRDCADAKKRKLLEDAFVNSFDPELYESGLLDVLWEKLDRLSYGDLTTLRCLVELAQAPSDRSTRHGILRKYGINNVARGKSLGAFHQINLVNEGLAWAEQPDNSGVVATELGVRMHQLAPTPEPAAP